MSLVSFVKVGNNATDSIRQAILESLNAIDYSFEKEVKNVVIKPNLCYYWDYSTGQTTDPKFVAALIDLIREKTSSSEISIVESDASAMKCKHIFRMLGYEKLSKDYNVKLIDLSEDKYDVVQVTVGGQSFNLMVPRTIQNADLKINVPKIKYTMEEIKITCALKNIFGCNPYPRKFRYHPRLGEVIVATNKAMRFDLCIIDGNIVSGIQPRRLGLVMASKDRVAIDAAAAKMAGVNPKRIKYLRLAEKEGLGNMSFVPRGISPSYFNRRYPRKDTTKKMMGKAYGLVTRLGLGKRLGLE
jgi:uncharacterized protein (DUF362 family)